MNDWLEVTIETTDAEMDALAAQLTINGAEGLVLESERDFQTFLEQNRHLPSFASMAEYMRNGDPYMASADFDSYCRIQEKASQLYAQGEPWQRMSLINVAGSGIFCADRSIHDYARDIWHL